MQINEELKIYGGIYTREVHSNFGKNVSRKVGVGRTKLPITFEPLVIYRHFMYQWNRKHL